MNKKYFSAQEVADICQVSRGSVIRWINEGKLVSAKTAGGHSRVWVDDLVKFLRELKMIIPQELTGPIESSLPKLTVLIVEDEENVLAMLRHFFETYFPQFEIKEAKDGFEAGLAMNAHKPQLVVLDIMLPKMDGYAVCEKIRKSPELCKTKIIAMSGVQDDSIKSKILSLGADIFFMKPFDLEALKNGVAALAPAGVGG